MQLPGIGQIFDLATDVLGGVGNLADEALTALTGSNLIGDVAGVAVNLFTGNVPGAIVEGLEGAHDLGRWAGKGSEVAGTCPEPPRAPPREGCGWAVSVDVRAPRAEVGLDAYRALREPSTSATGFQVRFSHHHTGPAHGCGSRPAESGSGSGPVSGGGSGGLADILNDPSLGLEDKVAMLFAMLTDDIDEEIEGKMRGLSGVEGESGEGKQDFQKIQTELQLLMQKRSQMMGLTSNLMNMFHQTSMQVIGNIR